MMSLSARHSISANKSSTRLRTAISLSDSSTRFWVGGSVSPNVCSLNRKALR